MMTPTTEPDAATIALTLRIRQVLKRTHDTSPQWRHWDDAAEAVIAELADWIDEQREEQA